MSKRCLLVLVVCAAGLRGQCAFERAVQLHQSGDLDGAMAAYRACLAAEPNRVDARSNLGAVLAKTGRYDEAIEQYREALKNAPAEMAPGLRFNLALAYYKSDRISEAIPELETAHRQKPSDLNVALVLGDCYLRIAEFGKAIALLTPFETSDTDQPGVEYVLGMALIRSGHTPEGQMRVERLLRRGESAEGHFLLGSALFMSKNYPGAAKELGVAVALDPNLPSLQSYYGQALLFSGDADGAAAEFRKELASNPNDYEANFQLASILAHRGKMSEARPLLERAAQLRPESEEARLALAGGFHAAPPPPSHPGVAVGMPAPAIGGVDLRHLVRPVALVFGSYTCPKLRQSISELLRLSTRYSASVDFRLVYIREAHVDGGSEAEWQSTINAREGVDLGPARDLAAKQANAALCVRKLSIPFPVLVDGMDTAGERAYDAWPSRVYLIGVDGRVLFNSYLGELDFRPAELESAIRGALNASSR